MEMPTFYGWLQILLCLAFGFISSWGVIYLILRWFKSGGPATSARDFHHAHKAPIPRLGGVALAVAFLIVAGAIYLFCPLSPPGLKNLSVIVLTSLGIFALGFWDDLRPLGARFKLFGQIAIACAVYAGNIRIDIFRSPLTEATFDLGALSLLCTVAWLVTMTNLINLIDGIDGLAGGICLMLMFLLANLGMTDASGISMLIAIGMAGALLGFLKFNYPPAKIYMGDGGAYFLGFLIGILSIVSSNKGTVAAALIAPAFALALPIVDVSLAVLRRALRGLPIFRADRKHIHHHLITLGISRERTVLNLYTVSLLCLFLAFGVFYVQGRMLPLYTGFLFLVLLIAGHLSGVTKDWFTVSSQLGKSLALRKETQYALVLSRWLVLEVERRVPEAELWEDYKLVVRKLGFARMSLSLPDGSRRTWEVAELNPKIAHFYQAAHDMSDGTVVEFHADKTTMPESQFDLLGDLAAETWYKIASRWLVLHKAPYRFAAETGKSPSHKIGSLQALSSSSTDALPSIDERLWAAKAQAGEPLDETAGGPETIVAAAS
jgi:UDP-GlcNAc:undecaprenyl-phosphate GlcNAc-1-phosphate transferase